MLMMSPKCEMTQFCDGPYVTFSYIHSCKTLRKIGVNFIWEASHTKIGKKDGSITCMKLHMWNDLRREMDIFRTGIFMYEKLLRWTDFIQEASCMKTSYADKISYMKVHVWKNVWNQEYFMCETLPMKMSKVSLMVHLLISSPIHTILNMPTDFWPTKVPGTLARPNLIGWGESLCSQRYFWIENRRITKETIW